MSAESASACLEGGAEWLRNVRILRYAIGTAVAVLLAQTIAWDLAYVMPILVHGVLASPAPRPTLKGGLLILVIISIGCLAGLLMGGLFLPYPAIFLLVIGLFLLHLFYAKAGGAPAPVITFLLITILLIPAIMMQSYWLAIKVAAGLMLTATSMILVVWMAYGLFPDPVEPAPTEPPKRSSEEIVDRRKNLTTALMTIAVVFPVVVSFFVLERLESTILIVFVAILSMQSGFAKDINAGKVLILGNLIGGAMAIVVYKLLVIAPTLPLLIGLIALAGLICGRALFSGHKAGPLYGMAFSTMLLIVGSVTTSTEDAATKVYSRITQIMCAVVYVVCAFGFLERWRAAGRA